MAEFSIRATLNGPFIVEGTTELLDTVGDKYPPGKKPSLPVDVANQITNHSAMGLTVRLVSKLLKK